MRDCPACGAEATFGKAKNWMRPPGFAHPALWEEETSPDDQPARSYATRAKLVAPGPADAESWQRSHAANPRVLRTHSSARHEHRPATGGLHLLHSVRADRADSDSEQHALPERHPKPYPDDREPTLPRSCIDAWARARTDFISDVLLVSLRVDAPLTLRPGYLATDVALRTLSEAITIAATKRLEIEPGELQAEYRPALTEAGHEGLEAEIYIYDTLAGGAGFARRVGDLGAPSSRTRSPCSRAVRRTAIAPATAACEASRTGSSTTCSTGIWAPACCDTWSSAKSRYSMPRGSSGPRTDSTRSSVRHGLDGIEFSRNTAIDVPGVGSVEAPILAAVERSQE